MAQGTPKLDDARYRRIMRDLGKFQREVEKDATKYDRGTLRRIHIELVDYGTAAIRSLERNYVASIGTANVPAGFLELMRSLRDRYVGLWAQNLAKAFATAENSIEGSHRGMARGKTILQRIKEIILGPTAPTGNVKGLDKGISGIVRTKKVGGQRQVFRIGITAYVKLLVKTLPANFIREADTLLLKERALERKIKRKDRLFLISKGFSAESAQTCIWCQGRVLTADAFEFVQRALSPNLFHPHCRHHVVRSFNATMDTYNGKYGPVLTLKDVKRWPSQSKKIRLRKKGNPHYIPA